MEADSLTIAYYDEDDRWEEIYPFIMSQLPLNDVNLNGVAPINGFGKLGDISPCFVKHQQAFWGEAFEDAFRKPYLWIYLLSYSSLENFKAKSKGKIREMVNNITEKEIEWLILFVHPLSSMVKTQHKGIFKVFEKISFEINSMFGVKQCVKLYCNESRTFLCSDSPSDTYKNYLDELIKATNRCVSSGIYNRITFFIGKIDKIEDTKDFNLYLAMKEGLAITYSIAGLKEQAISIYDEILYPPDIYSSIEFGLISEDELLRTSEITLKEFRSNNKAYSYLYLRKYIFSCQKRLMESNKNFIEIGPLSVKFLWTCLGLFNPTHECSEKYLGSIWVYNHSLEITKYLQDKLKYIYPVTDKPLLHYSIASMLMLVRSRLQILSKIKFSSFDIQMELEPNIDFSLDRSPIKIEGRALIPNGLEDEETCKSLKQSDLSLEAIFETQYRLEEALLIITRSLFEHFSQATYTKFAQRYKVEQGILLTMKGMYDQAIDILYSVQNIEWDSLQVLVLLLLLQCLLNSGKMMEAVAIALKVCRFSTILKPNTINRLWKCVEDISMVITSHTIVIEEIFKVELRILATKVLQGDILESICKFTNSLPFAIKFNKVCCQLSSHRDTGFINLEAKGVKLEPGVSNFKLSGVASAQGKMKNSSIRLTINKLIFILNIALTHVIIEENHKCVSLIHKVPSLLVYNEVQLLAIEISTRQFPIEAGVIEFPKDMEILCNKVRAECISYTKEGKDNKWLDIHNYSIKLPTLPSHSRLYVIVEIRKSRVLEENEKKGSTEMCSSVNFIKKVNKNIPSRHLLANKLIKYTETVDFHADLLYTSNNNNLKEPSNSSLDFISPLSILSKFIKLSEVLILQLQILNCSHLSIQTLSWSFTNCTITEDSNNSTVLRTGQIQHLLFTIISIKAPAKISITYASALKFHEKKMHIDPVIDRKMKEQQFCIDHVLLVDEVATYTISEPVVINLECCITVSLLIGKIAKARIEKTSVWDIKSPALQEFVGRCEIKIIPRKAGNRQLPEIIVWVGEKRIKTEGPKNAFVSAILKK